MKRLLWGLATVAVLTLSLGVGEAPQVAGEAAGFILPADSNPSWGLSAVRAPEAWEITTGSERIVVAVIDSGIDRTIPALADRMWTNPAESANSGRDDDGNGYADDLHGWDFRDGNADSLEGSRLNWHGTFVAGLIAASFDTESGAGGVAPEICIMDLRFLDSRGLFFSSDWPKLARAIDYAVDNGAHIINLSMYAKMEPPPLVRQALQRAAREGVFIVGIAGNDGERVGYFGRYPEVFTVSAVDEDGRPAPFSNWGPEVDLTAPGVNVLSSYPGGSVRTGSGTSFAAPYVTGTAALMLSLNPEYTLSELRSALQSTAAGVEQGTSNEYIGAGLVDTAAAARSAAGR
ncbi:MAG: S8 family peptidase [Candidatus Bipolaricaulota bacterium]